MPRSYNGTDGEMRMVDGSRFGPWLKEQRRARAVTQAALAARIGCSTVTIEKIESGARRPSVQVAELLAEWLAVPPEERAAFTAFARDDPRPAPVGPPRGPWRSGRPPARLVAPATGFIGRTAIAAAVADLLRAPDVRLLTLTGPPGIGKTRLSLKVASDLQPAFADGVFFVPLAPVRSAAGVVASTAQTLALRESGPTPLAEQIAEYLRDRTTLLVLDNF
ncbi:MAG TPA: helix-turn-helix domain-containing protein, partial [Chloroflexia bacterium]|nr:helix-turn-helix domain-containing protein [Chloroflexia bacterium]